MIFLLLACLPGSDVEERLAVLEAENAELSTRLDKVESANRELMQQLARWEQAVAALEAEASSRPLSPADLNAPAPAPSCTTDADGTLHASSDLLADTTVAKTVRVIPHKSASGEVDGFRLSAIRRGSLLETCGFKNGDIIHSVNGSPLTSASGAMEAYNSLLGASVLDFSVGRRGKTISVSLTID